MLLSIARNLISGLRLLVPGPLAPTEFRPSLLSASTTLILSLALMAVFDFVRQKGEIGFSDYGAATVGCLLFAVLFVSIVVARMQSELTRLPLLLTALFSAMPWYVTAVYAYRDFLAADSTLAAGWLLLFAWGIAALVRSIRVTFGASANGASAVAVFSAFIVVFVFQSRYFQTSLFYSYDPADYERYVSVDVEDVYYRQRALVADKVGQLLAERPDVVDTYFVGFAGNGDQSIFSREALFAKQVVERQFDATGRAIHLASDIDSLHIEPLANRHNLRASLNHIGQLMDTDDDVLFLFLTSHGSRDATLDTSLHPFDMQDLSADEIREYLDESGILWRVIIVSACYSGSFIDALRNDRAIVISAAADDKNSFGCSDDRDLTYFGEEFLANQLSHNKNLIEAFDLATASIEAKEVARGYPPSEPQIYVGPLIRDKLAEQVR